jgi:hypothetical protein
MGGMKIVEEQKWVEHRDLGIPEGPLQMDSRALDGGLAVHDFPDFSDRLHNGFSFQNGVKRS